MKNLLIRADASTRIGSGHIMRCLALAQHWQANGGTATFLSACEGDALRQRIESAGIGFMALERPHPDPLDLQTTLSAVKQLAHSSRAEPWVILDGYHLDSTYQSAIRLASHRLMVIDDTAHLASYHADVLLNQNINAERLSYHCDPETLLLLGSRYALLRQEFLAWRDWQRETPEVARRVLVTMGGSDPDNVTGKIIHALRQVEVNGLEIVVVVGGNNPHYDELQLAVASSEFGREHCTHPPIQLLRNAYNMPELMAWADLGISAGGSACWELAYMGLPGLIVVLADNQQGISRGLHEAGGAINLGWHEHVDSALIAAPLSNLLKDQTRRQRLCQTGRAIVDGMGVDRVISALEVEAVPA